MAPFLLYRQKGQVAPAVKDAYGLQMLWSEIKSTNTILEGEDCSEWYGKPATETKIADLEATLGYAVPAELRASYQVVNGATYPFDNLVFCRVDQLPLVIQGSNNTMDVPRQLTLAPQLDREAILRPRDFFGRKRIPFADGSECILFVDMAPSALGTIGQVLRFDYGMDRIEFLATSFKQFLEDGLARLRSKIK